MLPIRKVYLFDTGGLVSIVEFRDREYVVKVEWSPEVSLFGSRLVASAMKYKLEKQRDNFKFRDVFVFIGDKYVLAMQYKKISEKQLKRIAKKVYEILVAVKSFDPKELGEVVAKAVLAEFTV